MKQLTIEDLESFLYKCENSEYGDIRFSSGYLDTEMVKNGISSIIQKIKFASMKLEELNDADKLLLNILNAQRGFHF